MKTPVFRAALPISATLIIGFAAGWLMRGGGVPADSSTENADRHKPGQPAPTAESMPAAPDATTTGVWDSAAVWSQLPAQRRSATLRHILSLPDGSERMAHFIALLRGFDREDIGVAALAIREGGRRGLTYNEEWNALVAQWGRFAGREAVENAFDSFGIEQKDKDWFSKMALRGWAEADPQSAIGWINAHPDHTDWAGCVHSIANGVGISDPTLAAALMAKTLSGPDIPPTAGWVRDRVAADLTGRVAASGGVPALNQWLASIPSSDDNGEMRRIAFTHTAARIERGTDAEAQEFFTRFADDPQRNQAAYAKFMTRLATNRSPQDALNWSASLPQPASGTARVFSQWQTVAPQEAAAWLAALPQSTFKSALSD